MTAESKPPKRLDLPEDLFRAVRVARFAIEHAIDPAEVAQLIVRARKAFAAGERSCNSDHARARAAYERVTDDFERWAISLGFTVQWSGLWPTLYKGERSFDLPT
jgi:hypothetical protein